MAERELSPVKIILRKQILGSLEEHKLRMSVEFGNEPTHGRGLVSRSNLVVKQVGTLWEVGKKRERVEIPKALGIGGNKKRFLQHCIKFPNRKDTLRWKPLRNGKQLRVKDAGSREFSIF